MKIRLRDGSGWRAYKHVVEDADRHGNVRVYLRRKGFPKVRLMATPGTEAFDQEYRDALAGQPAKHSPKTPAAPATLLWLCRQYFGSAVFQALGASTRAARRGILEGICKTARGPLPYALMRPSDVAKIRDEKAGFPEAANARVKALRRMFDWACDEENAHAKTNPAKSVKYLPSNNPDGFKLWSEEDVAKYEARHPIGTKARLALDLMLYVGVRRSDVVRLGPQMEQAGKLCFTETKGRARQRKAHKIPIVPELRASIDATPTGHLVYLVTEHGKPHSVKGFGNWFKKRCREAGVDPDLSAHGVRKTSATRGAEDGASEKQLMAMYGWTNPKQAAHYTKGADRERLEAEAAEKIARPKGNEKVPLSEPVASGGTSRRKKA